MIIRNICGNDLPMIFEKWGEFLPHENASKQNIIRKIIFDSNFDRNGFFIAEKDGEMYGFINAVYHTTSIMRGAPDSYSHGYINAFAVKQGDDFEKTGNLLLECAENYHKEHGKKGINTGYFPVYFTQGVCLEKAPEYASLYRNRGYLEDKSACLDLNLAEFIPFEKYTKRKMELEEAGFYIGALTDEYILSAIDPSESFSDYSWSCEFKNRLVHDFNFERMRIVAKDNKVIGACIFDDPASSAERFGPFGVSPEYRGLGLGAVLLQDCLVEMKKRSLHNAWMQWVAEDSVAWMLYTKFGFKKTYTYLTFHKEFEA